MERHWETNIVEKIHNLKTANAKIGWLFSLISLFACDVFVVSVFCVENHCLGESITYLPHSLGMFLSRSRAHGARLFYCRVLFCHLNSLLRSFLAAIRAQTIFSLHFNSTDFRATYKNWKVIPHRLNGDSTLPVADSDIFSHFFLVFVGEYL